MPARILVVDDLATNAKLLEAKLEREYFDVFTVASGEAALDFVRTQSPDIVLLDIMMPGMDGFEVCRQMKAEPKIAHIPIVMVTALSDVADRVRGIDAGADDFLTKPVNEMALFARVKSLVRLKMMTDELRLREGTSEQLGAITEGFAAETEDIGDACLLLIEDDESSVEKIRSSLADDGYELQVASSRTDLIGLASRGRHDVLLISLDVADDDALRLCSQLRSNDETRHTPIVLLVEENDMGRLAKALELGVNDYLVRPVDRQELVARMRTQVRRKKYQDRLRANYRRSVSMAVTDGLTEVYNRRYLSAHLESQIRYAAENDKPLAALMIDIDHFKTVNDAYGHAAGDEVLREVARRIGANVRSFDMVARYGGEEFAVVMPNTEPEAAAAVAERLRAVVSERPIKVTEPGSIIPVTISVGIGTAAPGEAVDATGLLGRADDALYAAKDGGRNRVCSSGGKGEPLRLENGTAV